MKKFSYTCFVFLLSVAVLFPACISVQRVSNFNSETVQIGMSKQDIIGKFGKPYKENFKRDDSGVLYEDWYYKEILFKFMSGWYELNSILHLKDGKLVSYEMGEEQRLTENSTTVKPAK